MILSQGDQFSPVDDDGRTLYVINTWFCSKTNGRFKKGESYTLCRSMPSDRRVQIATLRLLDVREYRKVQPLASVSVCQVLSVGPSDSEGRAA